MTSHPESPQAIQWYHDNIQGISSFAKPSLDKALTAAGSSLHHVHHVFEPLLTNNLYLDTPAVAKLSWYKDCMSVGSVDADTPGRLSKWLEHSE